MSLEVVDAGWGKFQILKGDLVGETTRAGTLWDGAGFLMPLAMEHGLSLQLDWKRNKCEKGTIIDIGANIGTFSVWCAAEGAQRVIAVEPVPETFSMLRASLDLNRFCDTRVIPLQIAAYDRVTYLDIGPIDPGNIGGTAVIPVKDCNVNPNPRWADAAPLDNYAHCFSGRVSLIKCDAQGCDLRALRGLRKTIERDHPCIIFEWERELAAVHGDTLQDAETYLKSLGYQIAPWPTHPNNFVAWREK